MEQLQLRKPGEAERAHRRHHVSSSGIHSGDSPGSTRPLQISTESEPTLSMTQTFCPPSASDVWTMRRAKPRMGIERHPRGELRRVATGDGNREQVAEEVEDDGLAVGADPERDPAPLGHVAGHQPVHLQGQARALGLVPAAVVPRRRPRRRPRSEGFRRRHTRYTGRRPQNEEHDRDRAGISAHAVEEATKRRSAGEQGRFPASRILLYRRSTAHQTIRADGAASLPKPNPLAASPPNRDQDSILAPIPTSPGALFRRRTPRRTPPVRPRPPWLPAP